MDEFLQSVSRSFGENRATAPAASLLLLVLVGVGLGLALAAALRRLRARRSSFLAFAAAHGLDEEDRRWVAHAARTAGAEPMDLLVHVDLFERITAQALSAPAPAEGPDPAERLGRLRRALGFDRLAPHHPLLTTRELAPGTALDLDGARGEISASDERGFTVDLREGGGAPAAGRVAALAVTHAREARYTARCPVRSAARAEDGSLRLRLDHDEAPVRVQRRQFVRVAARGTMVVRPRPGSLRPGLIAPGELRAALVDVSAGGARIASPQPLPVGLLVTASFSVEEEVFAGLGAVVLSAGVAPGALFDLHLEFTGMEEARRERLVAAVARLERAPRQEERDGGPRRGRR